MLNLHAFQCKRQGLKCELGTDVIYLSFLAYISHLLLFLHFFFNSYLRGNMKKEV